MRASVAVVVGSIAVAVGVLLLFVFRGATDREVPDVAPPSTEVSTPSSAGRSSRRAGTTATGECATGATEEDIVDVRGVVQDWDGKPIEGANVRLLRTDADGRERGGEPLVDLDHPVASASTAADGSFLLSGVARDGLVLVASKSGYVTRSRRFDAAQANEKTVVALLAARLREVHVVDESSHPIRGAELVLVEEPSGDGFDGEAARPIATDADGRAQVPTGNENRLIVRATGFVTTRVYFNEQDDSVLEIVLHPGLAAAGVVVDGEGRPLAGVHVRIDSAATELNAVEVTREDGRFAFDGLDPRLEGDRYGLHAALDGRLEFGGPLVPGDHDIRIVLPRTGTVRGVVVHEDGRPAAGVSMYSTETDAQGRFELVDFPTGQITLTACAPSPGDPRVEVEGSATVDLPEGGSVDDVRIVVRPPERYSYLIVRVESEARLPKVHVVARCEGERVAECWTDADLPTELAVRAPPGTAVVVAAQGAADEGLLGATTDPPVVTRAAPPFETVELKLAPARRLRLKLVGPDGVEVPLDPARVSYMCPPAPDGTYPLSAVETSHLTLSVPGFAVRDLDFEPPHPALREETVRLVKAARVTGRVVRADGKPAPGDTVIKFEAESGWGWKSDSLDDDGRFAVRDRPPGRARLRVMDGNDVLVYRELDVAVGADCDVGDVVLPERRTFRGLVVDGDGRGVGGAQIWFTDEGNDDVCRPTSSGPDGAFEVALAGPSSLHLRVKRRGFATKLVEVAAGSEQPVRVVLAPGCRVRVLLAGFSDAGWSFVGQRLLPGSTQTWGLRRADESDADDRVFGVYDDVPPGPVEIVYSSPRRELVRTVEAVPGRTVDCTFTR